MSIEPEAAPPPPQSPPAPERFLGFGELRTAHLGLRAALAETGYSGGGSEVSARVREFLAKAQRTGVVLQEPSMRRAAQGLLDYWCAELAGLPDAKKEDFAPLTLAPLATELPAQAADDRLQTVAIRHRQKRAPRQLHLEDDFGPMRVTANLINETLLRWHVLPSCSARLRLDGEESDRLP